MGELTLQFPLHRHVLSDFACDEQRHSHPSKGLGVHELCHQCMVTGCLVTVCWILRWESRGTQSTLAPNTEYSAAILSTATWAC